MPIIDEKEGTSGGRMALALLRDTGVVALFQDEIVYCIDCMFKRHSHKLAKFWSLDSDDIENSGKVYICDDCGKEIN